jgi:metallo-beta-lactamase class B
LTCIRQALMILAVALALSVSAASITTTTRAANSEDRAAFPAYRVIGDVYFIGSKDLGIFLVTTPQGHILVNAGMPDSVPMIQANVQSLGFRFQDIKILLISHAHFDHDGGVARVKELTGAKYMVMDADVPVVESGGKEDFFYANAPDGSYPPAKVDRVLHDGDIVQLGETVLTAHLTPGHTKGCTTWSMKVRENSKTYDLVIVGSPNVNPGYQLVKNTAYPQIADDFEKNFRVLRSLHCDIFLGAHGSYYDMETKYRNIRAGAANPFIDPKGYTEFVEERERAFRAELARQRAAVQAGKPESGKTDEQQLVGYWRGDSICVVRPSACHDEKALYHVKKREGVNAYSLQADKIVDGKPEMMGTADCTYAPEKRVLTCTRPNLVLHLTPQNKSLSGTMNLPDGTVWRNISLKKDGA